LSRECDERTAVEIQSSLTTGVLKNHHNDAYTRMSQNITRVNTSQRKQAEAREREAAVDEIENELTLLTKTHQETRDRLKSLKASKADLRKRKSSSKAESNSSGRIRTRLANSSSSSAKAKKATMAAKIGAKKSEIKSRKDSSSLTGSSTANQAATFTTQISGSMEMDFIMGGGDVLQTDWVNGMLPSGPIVEDTTGHSNHVNHWTTSPFPPPHQTSGVVHHISEQTLFDSHLASLPSSQYRDTTSTLHDIDYFALSELGTTTGGDGLEMANSVAALDSFEKTFGSYVYPQ